MKSKMKTIAKLVVAVMATNSAVMTWPTVQNAEAAPMAAKSKATAIARAVSAYEKATKIDKVSGEIAATELVRALSAAGVTKDDLMAYTARYASPSEAKRAAQNVEFALKGVSSESFAKMTEAEQASVIGEALKASNAHGVAWTGCAGLVSGVVLIVAAVVVGIIGATKMTGEKRIRSKYAEKRSSLQAQLEADIYNVQNRPTQIQTQISNLTTDISNANNQISYWQGQLDAALANGNLEAAQAANANIQSYQADVTSYNNQIVSLNNELSLYSNPNYAANQIAAFNTDYASDLAALNSEEANKIALVPENQRIGKGMLLGAGIGAAIGTYLTIDGAQTGCN